MVNFCKSNSYGFYHVTNGNWNLSSCCDTLVYYLGFSREINPYLSFSLPDFDMHCKSQVLCYINIWCLFNSLKKTPKQQTQNQTKQTRQKTFPCRWGHSCFLIAILAVSFIKGGFVVCFKVSINYNRSNTHFLEKSLILEYPT